MTDGEILAPGTPRLSSRKAKENMCDGNKCDRQALDTFPAGNVCIT